MRLGFYLSRRMPLFPIRWKDAPGSRLFNVVDCGAKVVIFCEMCKGKEKAYRVIRFFSDIMSRGLLFELNNITVSNCVILSINAKCPSLNGCCGCDIDDLLVALKFSILIHLAYCVGSQSFFR